MQTGLSSGNVFSGGVATSFAIAVGGAFTEGEVLFRDNFVKQMRISPDLDQLKVSGYNTQDNVGPYANGHNKDEFYIKANPWQ